MQKARRLKMKRIGFEKVSAALIILALSLNLGNVWAEEYEETAYYEAEEDYTDTQGTSPGYDKGKKVGWRGADAPPGLAKKAELEKLKKLKEENPEKFKQVMQNRKDKLKKRLAYLKENNPEKFKALMKQRQVNQEKKLEYLRRTNPEEFKQVVENRKNVLENRLQKMKENNPEKFKEIVQKRKTNQVRHLQHLKKTNPEKYKAFLKKNPRLRDHAEDVRDKREDFRGKTSGGRRK